MPRDDTIAAAPSYFPPAESRGGWRWPRTPEDTRRVAGLDPDRLQVLAELQHLLHGGGSWAIAVVRRGRPGVVESTPPPVRPRR